ncbi:MULTISPECIES: GntR family transcriptional regulator [Streptomyces]|uniref:GntR family transcriptional regulator n=1 Tax=Streptomyces TaxID=1883 RepID=UPI000AD837D0|nr:MULTISPECIES: GntR family transcriptional regulator [Streptomyces]MDH6229330.1 GntR family transcriptional regulator [Streptomyces sp. MJP52]
MLVTIDRASSVSLAEQIAASVRRNITEGKIQPGDRLPPARTLAHALDINMHTVLRGYQILKEEELIELRRGRGAVVIAAALTQAPVIEACQRFIHIAVKTGMTAPEILQMVKSRLDPLI